MLTKNIYTRLIAVLVSAVIQAFGIVYFIYPGGIISGGFTGLGMLLENVLGQYNINISLSVWLIIINFPVAFLCSKELSKKFAILSLVNIATVSAMIKIFENYGPVVQIFTDPFMSALFGGVICGLSISIALKANASTGGTDFIAMYVSNRIHKSVWMEVLVFNAVLYVIFGITNTWTAAGYSIVYSFVSTKVIDTFYNRYKRLTLQIYTTKKTAVIKKYTESTLHALTVTDSYGGYKGNPISLIHTVISAYEKEPLIKCILKVDPDAVINVLESKEFIGGFYLPPID